MSLYTVIRHPHVHRRRHRGPEHSTREHVGVNGRIAAWVTRRVGSMWTVYGFAAFSLHSTTPAVDRGVFQGGTFRYVP